MLVPPHHFSVLYMQNTLSSKVTYSNALNHIPVASHCFEEKWNRIEDSWRASWYLQDSRRHWTWWLCLLHGGELSFWKIRMTGYGFSATHPNNWWKLSGSSYRKCPFDTAEAKHRASICPVSPWVQQRWACSPRVFTSVPLRVKMMRCHWNMCWSITSDNFA